MYSAILNLGMKLQLTKDKTIEINFPSGGAGRRKLSDVTGVFLNSGDPRGCPAVRLQRRKGAWSVAAAGFVPPPSGELPASWEQIGNQPTWSLPPEFQASAAAIAVASPDMLIRQTTPDALTQDLAPTTAPALSGAAAPEPAKKKLGIRREAPAAPAAPKAAETAPAKAVDPGEIQPRVPVSSQGMRFVMAPLAEEPLVIQSALPEYQVLWLSRLLPEGKRPTAASVQTLPSALLASISEQPEFAAVEGNALAIYVMKTAVYFAAYRAGQLLMFRQCPGAAGWEMMREGVKLRLGLDDEMVDEILDDAIVDPRSAMEPFVRPVLQQLEVSLQYLASRLSMRVDKVFVMGLPSGARYWSQMAEDALQTPLVAPSAFEGLALPPKDTVLAGLTPSQTQVFLPALGAARAAMEVDE